MTTQPVDLWHERVALRRRALAGAMARGELDTGRVAHGKDGFALDLCTKLCELCDGSFPPLGFAHMWLDPNGDPKFAHMGCFSEAINWTETE